MYSRVLLIVALLVAEVLLYIGNARRLFYPALGVEFGFLASLGLGFPVGFFILSVMVRTVPHVVRPRLLPRDFGTVTTLGLADQHDAAVDRNGVSD